MGFVVTSPPPSPGSTYDPFLFRFDAAASLSSQFAEVYRESGNNGVLSIEDEVSEPTGKIIQYEKAASAGGNGFTWYALQVDGADLQVPASGIYEIGYRWGPRDGTGSHPSYGDELVPYVAPLYQANNRLYRLTRGSTTTTQGVINCQNNESTNSFIALATNSVGGNNDEGSYVTIGCRIRVPTTSVDPGGRMWLSNSHSSEVSGWSLGGRSSWTANGGATTPEDGQYDAAWQQNANTICIGFDELTTAAGKTYFADLYVREL